ncbi:MAG TPA: transglycosylase domain-containing protein [Acidimicrobiales bacterium]|jgi:penicillin-binding protein 1A|nr:transglycosylase domain-containing protein [Acidimicrobiales bacterium]
MAGRTTKKPTTAPKAAPRSESKLFWWKRATKAVPPPVIVGGFLWRMRRWLFVFALLLFGALGIGLFELTRIPLPKAHVLAQTSFVYDSSGHQLASFSDENRVDVTLPQVAPIAIQSVVSTEDREFFSEGAINPISMVRAMVSDVSGSGNFQGGSTITQQYVKQTYLTAQRTISRKLKEAGLAIRVSRDLSKKQILQGYLNTIYWGRGSYGIQAAAQTYFGVNADQLNLPESALLAGMIREPEGADPTADPAVARQNQQDTLRALVRDRKITAAQAAAAGAIPFSKFVKAPHSASTSVSAAPNGADYFIEAVRQQLLTTYSAAEIDGGGLKVYTTLDPTLQAAAYNSVYGDGTLNPAKGGPSGALVSMDNSGEVKALVGGQDYQSSSVDLALGNAGGGSGRQPGSTFKGIMLAELLKLGYSPESVLPAPPEVVIPGGNNGAPYTVTNFEHEATAPQMSVIQATANSVNTVYVQIVDKIGPSNLDAMAEALGIPKSELGDDLSEVLGTDAVSPLQMTAAYATFADDGVYHAPLLITRVTNSAGKAMPLPVQPVARQVLTPTQDAELTYVLEQVVLNGTGGAAGGVGSEVAGKTGTTENSADAWFDGYTPHLTTAVWMGYAKDNTPMYNVQGGTIPAQMWHHYMAAAIAAEPQWAGNFAPVYYMGGLTLTAPAAGSVLYPEGLGTTTTSSTSTTVPSSTTTNPHSTTTIHKTTPTTAGHSPPTTRPTPTTSPPTTARTTTTTAPGA